MSRVARENLWNGNEVISHEVTGCEGYRLHLAVAAHPEKIPARVRREGEDPSRVGVARLRWPHTAPDCRPRRSAPARDLDCRWAVNGRAEVASDIELCSTSVVKGREAHDGVVQPATKG